MMMRFLVRSRKRFVSNVALVASCVNFLSPGICYTQPSEDPALAAFFKFGGDSHVDTGPSYTVNFNNVPVIEVIRFVSKVTNMNFVFSQDEIQFNVSIISEEPISIKNIMSALIQVLRINNLTLLEQDNSLIITKSLDVNQIPTIVSGDIPDSEKTTAPIVTRVFRIKNAAVSSVANIIRPMTSKTALIEVSNETRQLIVTDITTNVEKIASLLTSLDAPHTPLEIDSYEVKNVSSHDIIALTTQILSPFTEGNPLIFVPQLDTNTIFIVSTPYLIERAMTVMEDIDTRPKNAQVGAKSNDKQNVYIYNILNRSPQEITSFLQEISNQLVASDPTGSAVLVQSLRSAKYVQDTNSLLFITDAACWSKILEILNSIDSSASAYKTSVFIYSPRNTSNDQLQQSLLRMTDTLHDIDLINAIKTSRLIKENNSILFNGSPSTVTKLQNIIATLDATPINPSEAKSNFLIYNPKNQTGEDLQSSLKEMTKTLKTSGLSNATLIDVLEGAKWIPSTNSFVFTGDPASLQKVQDILASIDIPSGDKSLMQTFIYKPSFATEKQLSDALSKFASTLDPSNYSDKNLSQTIKQAQWLSESDSYIFRGDNSTIIRLKEVLANIDNSQNFASPAQKGFFLYKLKYAQGSLVIENLKNVSSVLSQAGASDKSLEKSISSIKWVKENNTLLITGSTQVIDQIKSLIDEFDIPSAKTEAIITPKSEFFIYKPVNQSPSQIQENLSYLSKDLEQSGLVDDDLIHTMNSAKIIPTSNSILFTGTAQSLEKLRSVLQTVDTSQPNTTVQTIGANTFLIYKIKAADADTLITNIKNFANELLKSSPQDKEVADVINSCKYVKDTNSILFTGNENALKKAEQITEKFDIETQVTNRENTSNYVVYNPKFQSGTELINILNDFMHNLKASGVSDTGLYDAISHLKFIDKTNSLIITGDSESIGKIEALLAKFDIPGKDSLQPTISAINTTTNFLIYKLQYHKGSEIMSALKEVSASLGKSGSSNKPLLDSIDSLQWVQVTNSLLGTGDTESLAKLKELIENIDVPLRQVFIEVLVIETTLYNSQTFGLQWGSQLQYLNKTIGAGGNFPLSSTGSIGNQAYTNAPTTFSNSILNTTAATPPSQAFGSASAVPFTQGFDLGVIGDIIMHKGKSFISLGGLINALQVDNATTVVMNPKIITQDGHTSTIFVGQNIPFTGSFVSNTGQSSTLQTSNIEYRDVGVNLTITPTLGTNNVITLDISQDISEQVPNTTTVQGSSVSGIQTSHTSMNTRVHVPNNHFLVLSGMIQDTKNNFKSGIPCLGGLPVVGALFSENDRAASKSNVIIFLRPIIINSFEDYDKLTEEEEAMFKENAVEQLLKEEFDVEISKHLL
ncbi:MAG: hypothetical protein EBZ47_05315, partial [Chlamydiae bacterium]|nr:hypothetical protein [Chlamydiota bacterium]